MTVSGLNPLILSVWTSIFTSVSSQLVMQTIYHPRDWNHIFISKDKEKQNYLLKVNFEKNQGFMNVSFWGKINFSFESLGLFRFYFSFRRNNRFFPFFLYFFDRYIFSWETSISFKYAVSPQKQLRFLRNKKIYEKDYFLENFKSQMETHMFLFNGF